MDANIQQRAERRVTSGQDGYDAHVVVKFDDRVDLPYEDDVGELVEDRGIGPWSEIRERFPGATLRKLYRMVEEKELRELVRTARRRDGTYQPPDFFTYFTVNCPVGRDPEDLAAMLREWRTVERAYVPGEVMPASAASVHYHDDDWFMAQQHLNAAPVGIGAYESEQSLEGVELRSWSVPGGDGDVEGLRFVDIEFGWKFDHEDLELTDTALIAGENVHMDQSNGVNTTEHGTSTLGTVVGRDNEHGILGIVPRTRTDAIGAISVDGLEAEGNTVAGSIAAANALVLSAKHLGFGDVVLVELQGSIPSGFYAPVEIEQHVFESVRLCTALGITVVEPAGNGRQIETPESFSGLDLDSLNDDLSELVEPVVELDRTDPDFQDSGAIMVGASEGEPPHRRIDFSNFGSRVDCFAWGHGIVTTTVVETPEGVIEDGYGFFGGTSGASAIVAGAALAVQGMAQANLGYRFGPRQLREILSRPPEENAPVGTQNTPSEHPSFDRIGVMPNLWWISQEVLNVVPDVYLRDHVGDTGDPAESGAFFRSPDIFVRPVASDDPQTEFGTGANVDSNTLGSTVFGGEDNYVYVRLLNRGGDDAEDVTATVYYSPPATLTTPDLWTRIGATDEITVPQGDILQDDKPVVPDAIEWHRDEIPEPGHYCFVALVGNDRDPAPEPADFHEWENYVRFVRERNNVAWRNFNVVSLPTDGLVRHEFLAPGATRDVVRMGLRTDARLPKGSQLFVELPVRLAAAFGGDFEETGDGRARIPVNPYGQTDLGVTEFAPGSKVEAALLVSVPEDVSRGAYEASVAQTFEGEDVGRVTWRFDSDA